jgi:DNA-binding transcriptional LysR family regulator
MAELRHLRYFVAVAEELNFSRAARRLRMAQPPLSVAIRQLEQELGTKLFLRTSREVRLTDAGQVLLDGARRTLATAERALEAARRAGTGDAGALRLAYSWSARFETLPALGQAQRARHPEVELLAQEMWNARMTAALLSGAIDVAIALCPELADDLAYAPIRSEPLLALVAGDHALADETSVALASLADEEFLFFSRELAPRLYDVLVGLCRQAGFEPKMRSGSFHTSWDMRLVTGTPVVAIAPASVSHDLPEGVTALDLSDVTDRIETALVWRADDPSPTLDAFVAMARDFFAPAADGRLAPGSG